MHRIALLFALAALPALGQTGPDWVKRPPKQAGYWIGIGVARLQGDLPRARERALGNALNHIAVQIETRVEAETRLNDTDDTDRPRSRYRAAVRTATDARLEGAELVDTWWDDRHVWVYARLDTLRHARRHGPGAETPRLLMNLRIESGPEAPGALLPRLRARLVADLHAAGIAICTRREASDLTLTLALETRPGPCLGGVCFAFADAAVALTRAGGESPLLRAALTDLKGGAPDPGQALRRALDRLGEAFAADLIPRLTRALPP